MPPASTTLPQSPGHPARRQRRSRTAVAAAVLCLLAQVFATVHLVVVRHEVCADHGEVVHAGGDHGDAPAGAAGTGDATIQARAAADAGHGDDDDHCRLLTERRAAGGGGSPSLHATPGVIEAKAAMPESLPARTSALYRLAPKISPPHAA